MAKRILALALACLLLGAAALAEVTGPLFEAERMSDSGAENSGAFIYTQDRLEGLVDLEGNVLAEAQFGDLSYVSYGYYEATNEGGFNNSALVTTAGEALTPFEYSDFTVVSPNWAIGVVLEGTDDKDAADYNVIFGESDYATIVRNDVYYLPEQRLAGTLERKQYSRAREAGIGGWLLVEDWDGGITAYDAQFNAAETLLTSMYDAELIITSENELSPKALYSAVTGEKLSDKTYASLSGIANGYTAYYDGDTRLYGILNAQGEELCAPSFNVVSSSLYDGHYVKVTVNKEDGTSAEGLYDLEARALAVPALYERIYTWGDKSPINDGYVCVEQDGKLGFIDLEGNVTCPIQYAKDSVNYYGCTLGATDLTGTVTIIAADGVVTPLEGVKEIATKNSLTDSDGYFLTVKNADDQQGVVDWHGEQIVDFVLEYSACVYGSDCLFTGASIYKLER
ncbi:MAG: WG repeat-containing protein [Clostridia bacterium]|nr:WG repeat-containing protein [Clostridia bacterium]